LINRSLATSSPIHKDACYNLAVLFHTLGLPALAIPFATHVWLADPNDRTVHSLLGSVLADLEPEATRKSLEFLVKHQPSNKRAVHTLATLTHEVHTRH
jgi:hypothetical protein